MCTGFGADWYLSSIAVRDSTTNKLYTFPCDAWLNSKQGLCKELQCNVEAAITVDKSGNLAVKEEKQGDESTVVLVRCPVPNI
jgi:hypothetical protein